MTRREKIAGAAFVGVYVIFRMIADPFFWRSISEYYSYAFEVAFVVAAYGVFRRRVVLWKCPGRGDVLGTVLALLGGGAVFKAAAPLGAPIPFDLSARETLFLLLVVAPILEELIFRMALWEAFRSFLKSERQVLAVTTFLFALGHFAAYWFVPAQFHHFVLYQTSYVLLLGCFAGWRRMKADAVVAGVWVHFGFNLGFFLASKM